MLDGTIFRQHESARRDSRKDASPVDQNGKIIDDNAIKVEVHSCHDEEQTDSQIFQTSSNLQQQLIETQLRQIKVLKQ